MQIHTHWALRAVVLVGLLALLSVGALGAPTIGEQVTTDADGEVVAVSHPPTVSPDGEFEVVVETEHSAGTVVAFDTDAFAVNLSSDDAVTAEDNRVEFLDPTATDSTYTIDVDVDGGTESDVGNITAWVNEAGRDAADDEHRSSFVLSEGDDQTAAVTALDHPSTVEPGDEFTVTVETERSAGTVVAFDGEAFAVNLSSEEAVRIDDNRVEFLDVTVSDSTHTFTAAVDEESDAAVGTIRAWVNAEDRSHADDEVSSDFAVGNDTDAVESLDISLGETQIAAGKTTSLTVTATLPDGTTEDVTTDATLHSNNSSVATVTDDGTVSSEQNGTATLTAAFQDTTASVNLTVTEPVITTLSASLEAESITTATDTSVVVDGTLSDGSTEDVTSEAALDIDNESVATVADDGIVSGENPGETTLSVEYAGETVDVAVTVTEVDPPEITTLTIDKDLTRDTVTVTGVVESGDVAVESVDIGLSAEFTSFTETRRTGTGVSDGGTFIETIPADELVADGNYAAYATASDVVGNEIEVENDSVAVDTTPPAIQPRVSNLGDDPATLELQSDEAFTVTDIEITAENDTGASEERSVTTPTGFQSGFSGLEFDGTPIGDADTTFSISVTAEDEAGNERTDTIASSVTGYEIDQNGTAIVDPESVDGTFELNTNIPDTEMTTATVGQSSSPPATTATDPNQVTGEFIDVTDIGVDESDLNNATVRIPLDTLDEELRAEADTDSLKLFRSEDGDERYSSETVTNVDVETINGTDYVVGEVPGFSAFAVGVTDTTPPEVTSTTVDPDTEPAPNQSLTAAFEYTENLSGINVSATAISVSGPNNAAIAEDRLTKQVTNSTATVTVGALEADEQFDIELTVVDTAGNQQTLTETVSVADTDHREDDAAGGGGGGAMPAPPAPPESDQPDDTTPEPDDGSDDRPVDDQEPPSDTDAADTDTDDSATSDDESDVTVPGFGFSLTLVAVLGSALLAVRRGD